MALLHPESDLTMSLITLGADILRQLHRQKVPVIVDDLLEGHLRGDRRRTPANFFAALDLLYSVGSVEREGYRIRLMTEVSQPGLFDQIASEGNNA